MTQKTLRLNFDANLQSVLTRLLGVGSLDSTYKISPEEIPLNNQDFQLGINQQIATNCNKLHKLQNVFKVPRTIASSSS